MHNCMLEMDIKVFKTLHADHRVEKMSAIEAFSFGDDKDETPASRLIQMHYEDLGVTKDWNPERIKRLAVLWRMTIRELTRYVMCPPGHVEGLLRGRTIELPGPVMLLLFHMERLAHQQFLGTVYDKPLFPTLDSLTKSSP